MNLYDLSHEYRAIERQLDDAQDQGNVDLQELLKTQLELVEMGTDDRLNQAIRWIENDEKRAAVLDAEIGRLKEKVASCENRVKNLRGYVFGFMKSIGMDKFKGVLRTLSVRKGSKSLAVDDSKIMEWPKEKFDAALECGALKIIESFKVDKNLLKTVPGYLELPGVVESTGEDSLQIR